MEREGEKKSVLRPYNSLIRASVMPVCKGRQWLSGRMLDSRPRDRGFEPNRRHCVMSLSKTHLSYLSTSSTQEDPSLHN